VRRDSSTLAAIGTFNGCLGFIDYKSEQLLFESTGIIGAVEQIAFSEDLWNMFTYSRKDEVINCWDLRTMSIYKTLQRPNMNTNQRLYFDTIGKRIAFGNTTGDIYIYNTASCELQSTYTLSSSPVSAVSFVQQDELVYSIGCGVSKIKIK
jgi:WD40 repeat protein